MNISSRNKKIISVIGYANSDKAPKETYNLAYKLGKSIIDSGYILANGGLGGIMEAVSKGARDSANYKERSIIGIIPNYDKNMANDYIDIALPIGFDVGRNISLISVSDAVIVIGGGAGTLNEISLAWQMNKLIIALGDFGWGGKLANTSLDDRRDDKIYKANSVKEALNILESKIAYYDKKKFNGISNVMSQNDALEKISSYCGINKNSLRFLGRGNEGFVFTDYKRVYKIFIKKIKIELTLYISYFSNKLKEAPCEFLYPFDIIYKNEDLILHYKYDRSIDFADAVKIYNFTKEDYQELLTQYYFAGVVHTNMHPKNLLCNSDGKLFICDIGFYMLPFTEELFESMCRKTFAIYKLQYYLNEIADTREYLTPLKDKEDFEPLENFLNLRSLKEEFRSFKNNIGKFAVQRNLIIEFYKNRKDIKTIFDYGSGAGKISANIQKILKRKVYAYDIDNNIVKKYKENYNKIEYCSSNHKDIEKLINENKKFDSVLCSLVLCHPLAKNEKERLKIIDGIMQDLCTLSKEHILIVICNPLFNNSVSNIQNRLIDDKKFYYSSARSFNKQIFSSGRKREDVHRPLGFYEDLFKRYNLKIKNIIQSGDFKANHYKIINSDFMIFDLVKNK